MMTKPVITLRNTKGEALTYTEHDTNFTNLRDSTINFTDGTNTRSMDLNDTTTIEGAHNMLVVVDEATQKITIDNRLSDYTQEPMGFENRTDSTISFNTSNRTLTIAPVSGSFQVWIKGEQYTKSGSETKQIPNTTALYLIYYDASGVLQYRVGYPDWDNDAPVAYVYWNSASNQAFFADERHGISMDWATHEYLHRTRGASFANGFDISNYTTSGTGASDSDAQFDLSNGTFFDEDIDVAITHSNTPTSNTWQQDLQGPAKIPVMFHSNGTGQWYMDAARDYAVKNGTLVTYNLNTGGTWTTPDASNTYYVAMWIVATNFLTTPIVAIMGQRQDNKLSDAQVNNAWLDLDLTNFPAQESRPLYRVIFRTSSSYTNTPKAYIEDVLDIRYDAISTIGASGISDVNISYSSAGGVGTSSIGEATNTYDIFKSRSSDLRIQTESDLSNIRIVDDGTSTSTSISIFSSANYSNSHATQIELQAGQDDGTGTPQGTVVIRSPLVLRNLTGTQRGNWTSPDPGAIIFNSSTSTFQGWNGTAWVDLG